MKELKIQQNIFDFIKEGKLTFIVLQKVEKTSLPVKLVVCGNDSGEYLNVKLSFATIVEGYNINSLFGKLYALGFWNWKLFLDYSHTINFVSKTHRYYLYTIEILEGDK